MGNWLPERGVTEGVMASTAPYGKPVWLDLEPHFQKLHLAQAYSHQAPQGRQSDLRDAQRRARRLLADELLLSFVPDAEQRRGRTLRRSKHPLVRDRLRLQNQLEAMLEAARSKLSSVSSDLLGVRGRRMLTALAKGTTDPVKLAELGDDRLQGSQQERSDALTGSPEPIHWEGLPLFLDRLELLDKQIRSLDTRLAREWKRHEAAVIGVAQIPGLGVDAAQPILAAVGVDAETFPSASPFSSWAGTCPGSEESAAQNQSSRWPKGNRLVRRLLRQAAQAAVKKKGGHFQTVFRRLAPRLGYKGAVWALAHRLGRLRWKILHDGVA